MHVCEGQCIQLLTCNLSLYSILCISNSPFWYCDAGMGYVVGPDWRDHWDVVVTSAGKPAFYTEENRPFREVDIGTGKVKFKQVRRPDDDAYIFRRRQNTHILIYYFDHEILPTHSRFSDWTKDVSTLPAASKNSSNASSGVPPYTIFLAARRTLPMMTYILR